MGVLDQKPECQVVLLGRVSLTDQRPRAVPICWDWYATPVWSGLVWLHGGTRHLGGMTRSRPVGTGWNRSIGMGWSGRNHVWCPFFPLLWGLYLGSEVARWSFWVDPSLVNLWTYIL